LALTEDPEQQRARHRLIGATVLVLIAVVGLPRILDSRPKTAPNDIAVNIVTSLPIPGVETKPEAKVEPKPEAKVEEKPKAEIVAEAPKPVAPITPTSTSEVKAEAKSAAQTAPAPSKTPALGLAAGEEVVASTANTKVKSDNAAPKSAVKYVIPVGTFSTEEGIKNVTAKLKELKIPYTVYKQTRSDGTKLTAFRAGPFPDKNLAEAAEKKIKASLNPAAKVVETGKQ
jgi:DedD protein